MTDATVEVTLSGGDVVLTYYPVNAPAVMVSRDALDALVFNLNESRKDYEAQINTLWEALEDVVNQACFQDGTLDSMALSANADAMRLLAEHGRLVIDSEYGRRVIAHWPTRHDGSSDE